MLTNIVHRWQDIEKLRKGEMILPRFVDFHSSNICNMHCVGCQYDGRLSTDYMSEDDQLLVVDKFLAVGVKAFDFCGGGEPLFPPYMASLIRYINGRGAHTGFLSNGSIMPLDLASAIVDCSTYIRVSLEASNEEDYIRYKRVPKVMWTKVLSNIHMLQGMKRATHSDLEISVKFAVSKTLRGLNHYHDAISLGLALDAKRITFRAIRDSIDQLTDEEKAIETSILESELSNWDRCIQNRISYWINPLPASEIPQCWLNPFHTVVHWNGDMHQCCYGYYRPEQMYLGNIIKQSFEEIWFSDFHWKQIKGIKKEDCARVDCKFFRHHESVKEMSTRGVIEWL